MKDSLNYVFEEISKLKEQTQETEIKFWFVFIVSLLAIVIPFFQNLHKNKTDKLDKLIDDIEKTKTELEQLYIDNITVYYFIDYISSSILHTSIYNKR